MFLSINVSVCTSKRYALFQKHNHKNFIISNTECLSISVSQNLFFYSICPNQGPNKARTFCTPTDEYHVVAAAESSQTPGAVKADGASSFFKTVKPHKLL